MNKTWLIATLSVAAGLPILNSCSLDPMELPNEEIYTRNFIKEFGLIDPEQDWNMAKHANVSVNVGPETKSSVKIYGKQDDTYYLVADLKGLSGTFDVPINIPKTCNDLMVKVDGGIYYGKVGSTIDCTGAPVSRVNQYDSETGEYTYDPTDPTLDYTHSGNPDVGINVTTLPYLYFNAQQMAPILSKTTWSSYWSYGDQAYKVNSDNSVGVLPEIGQPNKTHAQGNSGHSGVTEDFAYTTEGNNGEFDVYPMFYGSNLVHTLGVYLIGDDGNPIRHDNGEIVKLPIYESKHGDDIQIKESSSLSTKIAYFELQDEEGKEIPKVGANYRITLQKGGSKVVKVAFYNVFGEVFTPTDVNVSTENPDQNYISREGSTYNFTVGNNGNAHADAKWGHIRLSAYSEINNFSGSNNGSEGDLAFTVVTTDSSSSGGSGSSGSTNDTGVTKLEISGDGVFKENNTGNMVMELTQGVTKTFDVVCKDADNNTITDLKGHQLKVTNGSWIEGKFISSISGNTVSIQGNTAEEYDQWMNVYLDLNDNDNMEEDEINFGVHVYVNKTSPNGPAPAPKRISRAEAGSQEEWTALISEGGALSYDNSTVWKDINKIYAPILGSADSYPVDKPLLLRSRGYHVKVMYNGKPWTGYFGMYIDWKWADGVGDFSVQSGARELSGTHYSQKELNEVTYNGSKFQYNYAATFVHPKSTNRYLCFEDWAISQPATDDIATDGVTTGSAYGADFNWDNGYGLYSSDRDLNDIIYRAVGLKEIKTSEIKDKVNDKGFSWIWALEDLGSLDDFDFNDVVMRISSITTNTWQEDEEGNEIADTRKIVNKVTFTPLAAGGTRKIYIHLNDGTKDYKLSPGKYSLISGGTPPPEVGKEYHEWFGEYSYTTMINTGRQAYVPEAQLLNHSCEIIVDSKFDLNITKTGGATEDAKGYCFYVTVNGDKAREEIDDKGYGIREDGTYTIHDPEVGRASQSFVIVEKTLAEGATTSTKHVDWEWPVERCNIMKAYPDFKAWVNGTLGTGVNWYEKKTAGNTYHRN